MASFFRLNNLQSCLEIFTTSACSFTLFHVNIRSLRKHWNEFQLAINSVLPITDAFVLTEINISNESTDQFSLPGFKSIFYTRDKRRGGGIAVFLKQDLIFSDIQVAFRSSESIALRILTPVSDLCLLAFYRPPSEKVSEFLAELRESLSALPDKASLCLVGDFNIDLLKSSKPLVCQYLTLF